MARIERLSANRQEGKGTDLANKHIDIQFLIEPDALSIYVRDRGAGFDPTGLPDPLERENLLTPTGRGILLMHTFMDEVEHSVHPEGGCVVRMKKYQRSYTKSPVDPGGMTNDQRTVSII